MSQENVVMLQRWRESWSRHDAEATLACLHDDVVIDFSGARGPFRGVYRGLAEVRGFLRSTWEPWNEVTIEFVEVMDCGADRVITVNVFQAHGRSSGVMTGARVANLWSFRDGLIHRAELFQSRDEALEAAGLSDWENAEQRALAEDAIGAVNSGDLDAFLALIAEDVEFTSMVAEAEGTTFRGHDGVRAWWQTVRGAFEDVHWELFDVRGSGDRGVLHFRMTGTLGGVPVEQNMWQATRLRDGKVIWWAFFRSEREAFEAVGLSA